MRHLTLMHGMRAPAQYLEGDEGSNWGERNMRENDYSENSRIFQDDEKLSTLTRNPNIIHELWDQYEFGIGHSKETKEFKSKERGEL